MAGPHVHSEGLPGGMHIEMGCRRLVLHTFMLLLQQAVVQLQINTRGRARTYLNIETYLSHTASSAFLACCCCYFKVVKPQTSGSAKWFSQKTRLGMLVGMLGVSVWVVSYLNQVFQRNSDRLMILLKLSISF